MTKQELIDRLFLPAAMACTIRDSSGVVHIGILQSIEREDGSGKCFNVKMSVLNPTTNTRYTDTFFVRTID